MRRRPRLRTILGRVLRESGRYAEAEHQYRLAVEAFRTSATEKGWLVAIGEMRIAEVLSDQGRPAEAEALARQALARFAQHAEPEHLMRLEEARGILGTALGKLGQLDEAGQALLVSYERLRAAKGEAAKQTREARLRLVRFLEEAGDVEEARRYRSRGSAPSGVARDRLHPIVAPPDEQLSEVCRDPPQLAPELPNGITLHQPCWTTERSRCRDTLSRNRVREPVRDGPGR